ncbi:MAG: hypothetical protein ABJ308_16040 [Halieaceae bacterium]
MRILLSILVASLVTGLMVYLSPIGAKISFQMLSGLFPAISAETVNTSTRHGLSIEIYNIGFLTFAALSGILAGISLFLQSSALKRLLAAAIFTALLSMASAAMFWPGEQLINIYALVTLTIVQAAMTSVVLTLCWSAFDSSRFIRITGSILVLLISGQGLFLPLLHTIAAVLYANNIYTPLGYLDVTAYVLIPALAIPLACWHYRFTTLQSENPSNSSIQGVT